MYRLVLVTQQAVKQHVSYTMSFRKHIFSARMDQVRQFITHEVSLQNVSLLNQIDYTSWCVNIMFVETFSVNQGAHQFTHQQYFSILSNMCKSVLLPTSTCSCKMWFVVLI